MKVESFVSLLRALRVGRRVGDFCPRLLRGHLFLIRRLCSLEKAFLYLFNTFGLESVLLHLINLPVSDQQCLFPQVIQRIGDAL